MLRLNQDKGIFLYINCGYVDIRLYSYRFVMKWLHYKLMCLQGDPGKSL